MKMDKQPLIVSVQHYSRDAASHSLKEAAEVNHSGISEPAAATTSFNLKSGENLGAAVSIVNDHYFYYGAPPYNHFKCMEFYWCGYPATFFHHSSEMHRVRDILARQASLPHPLSRIGLLC
jgi:hypothetical protein